MLKFEDIVDVNFLQGDFSWYEISWWGGRLEEAVSEAPSNNSHASTPGNSKQEVVKEYFWFLQQQRVIGIVFTEMRRCRMKRGSKRSAMKYLYFQHFASISDTGPCWNTVTRLT